MNEVQKHTHFARLKTSVSTAWRKASAFMAMLSASLFLGAGNAMAQLPTTAPPSRGSTDGDYITLMQDYAFDIFILVGLVMGTLGFIMVVKNTIGAYGEVQDGKGTWGQFGMNAGAGVLLLVFVTFMLTEAAAIL